MNLLPELLHRSVGVPLLLGHVVLGHIDHGVVLQQQVIGGHVVCSSEAVFCVPPTI